MFKLNRSEEIENIGTAYVYDHSSGCRLIYIENEDKDRVFTIGFNTLPDNDKGIPHIVEHCVLCGSDNFRVKDPFNILDKGSIHTYLNAMTYRDKTVYPVGSTNEADFKTLMRVYCDAVFKPLMYSNEGIFRQEGWSSDGKNYNGIVLNEMKGIYSDPAVVLSERLNKEMFEGCGYANDAGGNPDYITDLSYEEFLEFHKEHYHPSNAVIYLYGDINIDEYLNILDNEFLNNFEYRSRNKPYDVVYRDKLELEVRYNTTGKNILNAVFNTGTSDDVVKCTMFGILSVLWCYTEGGNIKEAVLNAGLGDKVSCDYDDSGLSTVMEITVENSDETTIEKFRNVLNETFRNIAENGVDDYKLKGVINSIKFFFKEEDFGYKPKGLFYGLLVLNNFLKGRENFEPIKINKIFEELESVDIKALVNEYFVDKGCYGILIADKNAEKKEKPAAEKNNESLISYQSQEDSPGEIKKLMSTKVSDISREGFKLKFDKDNENIYVPLDSGDIVYTDIYFDATDFENVTALSCFKSIADIYDESLSNDIDYYTGGFGIEVTTLQRDNEYRPVLLFRMKCLRENIEKGLDIFKRVISQTFTNRERVARLIAEARQIIKNGYIEEGNSKAVVEALAQVSGAHYWESRAKGIDYYNYLDSDIDKIIDDVNSVRKLFNKGNVFYAAAGGRKDKSCLISLVENTLEALNEGGRKGTIKTTPFGSSKGIIIDGNVNFNAAAFGIDGKDGVTRVAQQIIAREYIWDKIRLEGGAYGGGCGFGKYHGYMYSFRDPNFERTFDVFKKAGEYLAESNYSQSDIDRFIIGTVNEIDKPIKKHSLTRIAMRKLFEGEDREFTIKRREQILSAAPNHIAEFGQMLCNADFNGICSVGQEKEIKNCHFFKELYRID
ncbi:MAG: insulinase family protein [Clostridia bacterium]|nr:insulinase family protein [Clostridia bacterium]